MRTTTTTLIRISCLAALVLGTTAFAAPPTKPAVRPAAQPPAATRPAANLNDLLIPPELVVGSAPQLGIDPATVQAIRALIQDTAPKIKDAQEKLATDTAALLELVRVDHPDEEKCLAQLDKVIADESIIKRLHLALMLEIKAKLTPAQIAKLYELRDAQEAGGGAAAGGAGALPAGAPDSLRTKLREAMTLLQARQQAVASGTATVGGSGLALARPMMQDARALIAAEKYKEAEAKVDQVIELMKQ